jgi:hypothetical protein
MLPRQRLFDGGEEVGAAWTSAGCLLGLLCVHPETDAADDFAVLGRSVECCLAVYPSFNILGHPEQSATDDVISFKPAVSHLSFFSFVRGESSPPIYR